MADEQIERVWLAAQKISDASEAAGLLAELVEKNPLFAKIKDTPNTHLAVLDLTSLDRPSQHKGPVKFQLSSAGIERALPSLMTKPVHVTAGYDGHFERGKKPKAIGTFLGGVVAESSDGTKVVRAVLSLWDDDFPEEVAAIQASKDIMGASYEITFRPDTARRISDSLIEIADWEFSGGAILRKSSAAHPETQVLVAADQLEADDLSTKERNSLPDADFAYVKEGDRRYPIHDEAHRKNAWSRVNQDTGGDLSDADKAAIRDRIMNRAKREGDEWAKPYVKSGGKWVKKGAAMKHAGIPEELQAAVSALIADAVARHQAESETGRKIADLKSEIDAQKAQMDQMKKDHEKECAAADEVKAAADAQLVASQAKVAELETKLAEASAALETIKADAETLKAEADALKAEKAAAELEQKVEAEYTKLATKYSFDAKDQKLRAQKLPIVKKMVAGEHPSMDEYDVLAAGGSKKQESKPAVVPLRAGGAEAGTAPKMSQEEIKKNFPTLGKLTAASA